MKSSEYKVESWMNETSFTLKMRAAIALLPPSLVWNEVLRDNLSALTGVNLAGGVVEMLDELICICALGY